MEKAPKFIIQKDGHAYLFFDYRQVIFTKFEDIVIVKLMVQYKKKNAFRRIELVLRTILNSAILLKEKNHEFDYSFPH